MSEIADLEARIRVLEDKEAIKRVNSEKGEFGRGER